jgi:hypothetical protein
MTNFLFDLLVEDTVFTWKRYTKQATIRILGIMSEITVDIEEELCACYIEWQKAFDRGNWILLKQILKVTAIGCRERNLISKLYMDHSLKCTQEA